MRSGSMKMNVSRATGSWTAQQSAYVRRSRQVNMCSSTIDIVSRTLPVFYSYLNLLSYRGIGYLYIGVSRLLIVLQPRMFLGYFRIFEGFPRGKRSKLKLWRALKTNSTWYVWSILLLRYWCCFAECRGRTVKITFHQILEYNVDGRWSVVVLLLLIRILAVEITHLIRIDKEQLQKLSESVSIKLKNCVIT